MAKIIDLKKTVHELIKGDPDLLGIMQELGFAEITKPGMLNTVGRVMTIPKGALMRNLDLEKIKKELEKRGYQVKE
ncbi:MAG TPA: DUF1858 domain-containing protein [Firmicutes bacterium]|nr:DUF1858 domain-containing protein [Bacillota bacterium]